MEASPALNADQQPAMLGWSGCLGQHLPARKILAQALAGAGGLDGVGTRPAAPCYSLNYLKQYPYKKCDTISNDDDKKKIKKNKRKKSES